MAYNVTALKLAEYSDATSFERMCSALLVRQYPGLIPLGGSGDSGRDAIERQRFPGAFATPDGLTIFQFSLQKTWKRKLDSELAKVQKNGFNPTLYVFVTNQTLTTEAASNAQAEMKAKYGIEVEIYSATWLQAHLESPDYLHVRRTYLALDDRSLQAFLSPDEYAARRLDRIRGPDLPLFAGREQAIEQVRNFLKSSDQVLLLSAPPGVGKTKLMLEAARGMAIPGDIRFLRPEVTSIEEHLAEVDPIKPLLLFVDDAHDLEPLKQLITLLMSPEFKDKIHCVVASHPWGKEDLLREFRSRGITCREMDLSELSVQAMNDILRHEAVGVADEFQRGVIIKLAEGNPLVALLAADLLRQTGSLTGLSKHDVLTAYFSTSLDKALEGQADRDKVRLFLAIVAATRGIAYGQHRSVLAELLGLTQDMLDGLVERLEDLGLMKQGWSRLRVIPELLADYIAFDTFFGPGRAFDFREKVLNPFFASRGDRIFRTLAEAERLGATNARTIIEGFMVDARQLAAKPDAVQRQSILGWLKGFAFLKPEDSLLVLRTLLEGPAAGPSQVDSRLYGTVTLTNADNLREAVVILAETGWHCDTCLKETLDLLYLIGAQQNHSRSNQDPWGDSIRVLTEQIINLEPGKPHRVQDIALDQISSWLTTVPSQAGIQVIMAALLTLYSVKWSGTQQSATGESFSWREGFLKISPKLRELRERTRSLLLQAYSHAPLPGRIKLSTDLGHVLTPYAHSGTPDETKEMLLSDGIGLFSKIAEIAPVNATPERYALWKALGSLERLGEREQVRNLRQALWTAELEFYSRLTEWPGNIGEHDNWKDAEAQHVDFWKTWVESISAQNLHNSLGKLDYMAGQAIEATPDTLSAISSTIGLVAKGMRVQHPELLVPTLEVSVQKLHHLKRYVGSFLGELYLDNQEAASTLASVWIASHDRELQQEACRALLWISDENFGDEEVTLVTTVVAENNVALDRTVIGFGGWIIKKVQAHNVDAMASVLKEVASRRDPWALQSIADVLDVAGDFKQIGAKDLAEVVGHFVDLDGGTLDYHVEGTLHRLFRLDSDAWLGFWEARIQRERGKPRGESYWAAPFHLSNDSNYVSGSESAVKVLGTFLDWSSREDYVYQHNGATLFKLFSPGADSAIDRILNEWIDTKEISKLRTVARVLKSLGYSAYFLAVAKQLISLTSDDEVLAHVRGTVGSTGVVSGSMIPLFESRKADFQQWLDDPQTPLACKAFARHQVDYMARQKELHENEDWSDG